MNFLCINGASFAIDELDRMKRMREAQAMKKEKEAIKKERERLRAEIAKDKAERAAAKALKEGRAPPTEIAAEALGRKKEKTPKEKMEASCRAMSVCYCID